MTFQEEIRQRADAICFRMHKKSIHSKLIGSTSYKNIIHLAELEYIKSIERQADAINSESYNEI